MPNPTENKISEVTFPQYLTRVALKIDRTFERAGQVYFGELQELHRNWALDIVRSPASADLDPFYSNENIPAFLSHVCELWVTKGGKAG